MNVTGVSSDHRLSSRLSLTYLKSACRAGDSALHAIGESVSEMLDWVPAQLRVIRITRSKYACRSCNKVVQAAAPERLIAGGLASSLPDLRSILSALAGGSTARLILAAHRLSKS